MSRHQKNDWLRWTKWLKTPSVALPGPSCFGPLWRLVLLVTAKISVMVAMALILASVCAEIAREKAMIVKQVQFVVRRPLLTTPCVAFRRLSLGSNPDHRDSFSR